MRASWHLLSLLALVPPRLFAQSDTAAQRCAVLAKAPADSLPVDVEAAAKGIPVNLKDSPKDAQGQRVVAHFAVTAAGRIDMATLSITGTEDQKWLARFRHDLAQARFEPAQVGHCPVARSATFTFSVVHLH